MASCTINNAMKICNRDTSTAKVQKRCLHLQMQQYAFHHGLYSIWWQTQEHILITHDMKLSRGTLTGHKDTRFTNRKAEMQKQPNNKSVDRLKALSDQMKPREKYKTHRSMSIPEISSHNFFCSEFQKYQHNSGEILHQKYSPTTRTDQLNACNTLKLSPCLVAQTHH